MPKPSYSIAAARSFPSRAFDSSATMLGRSAPVWRTFIAERAADAIAVQEAGAFAVVMEMVPAELAGQITRKLTIPTVGIGAGNETDAQVLVWTDFAGLRGGRMPRFVKQYADLRTTLTDAARQYARDVADGSFPGEEHSFPE